MPREDKEAEARNIRANYTERWISIHGSIMAATATNFETQLAKLTDENNAPVVVFLNSVGGDFFACLKIYQLIIIACTEKKTPLYTVGLEAVQSGAGFILQAGLQRFAIKTTELTFHRAVRHYSDMEMNAVALAEELRQLAIIDATQLLIFTKRGHPISKIQELFARDAKINARRARKLNLVDRIIPRHNLSKIRKHIIE